MPSSVVQGKQEIKEFIHDKPDIETIVDVGAGSATYPKLLRYELAPLFYKFIAIEIWEPYVEMFQLHKHYEKIIIGDASKLKELPDGHCIIFGDVLEHMEKADALDLIKRAIQKYKHVVISIPLGVTGFGKEHYGNKYELHISTWEFDEINKLTDWEKAFTSKEMGIFLK